MAGGNVARRLREGARPPPSAGQHPPITRARDYSRIAQGRRGSGTRKRSQHPGQSPGFEQGLVIVKADANYKRTHYPRWRTKSPSLARRHVPYPGTGPESRRAKSDSAPPFPVPRQGVLVNNFRLEHLSYKSYNNSTHVRQNANRPERIYEKQKLQNKLPVVSRQAETVPKKLLFCKTNCRLPAVKPSLCGKDYFLQNKLPAASRQAEPVRKKLLFCKTNCRLLPAHQAMKMGGWLVDSFGCRWSRPSTPWIPAFAGMTN